MCVRWLCCVILPWVLAAPAAAAEKPAAPASADANRPAYPAAPGDPYFPHRDFPRLTTPQWVGEPGVEAVVVLSIDDLRVESVARYEQFLRPILDRLKKIDGRAPVSMFANTAQHGDAQVQAWLAEGASIEAHTRTHPCPLLQGGDLGPARRSYDECVDLLAKALEGPGARPVAFRMPCCDSMNSVSPRFFTEIFGKTTPAGNFLRMDSSVFVLLTANDPELPRELVLEPDGTGRFRKYIPTDHGMINFVEDYPYPWVIDRCCWEVPALMPSDWDAQHLNGKCAPKTVEDFKAAFDALVIKQGIGAICFHPHGWIDNRQMVELIDYAVEKHGKKIKFLNLQEVHQRLVKNFLGGKPLRAEDGGDSGMRLFDVDGDGLMDAVPESRLPKTSSRLPEGVELPKELKSVEKPGRDAGLRLVDVDEDGRLDVVFSNHLRYGVWLFTSKEEGWRCVLSGKRGEKDPGEELPMIVRADGTNNGAWFKDRHMWVQNEDTGNKFPHHVDSRSLTWMLREEQDPPPRSPEGSLGAMHVRPGFVVELMAAEPLVMDPIDIAWGPDGKAWVVEMADYPMGMSPPGHRGLPKKPGLPGGRVRFLEDTDGDGRYDKSTVFLDPIAFPTGVMPWRNGVIVTAAPEVFYAEDTDGDGKADRREPLWRGFGEGNQQHRVNHPRWGLDNWVYLANGDSSGRITSLKTGESTDIGGRDLRVRPDSGQLDPQTGRAQYGRNRDDWGNWFGCNNPNPGWHYALADHYLRRNPHVAYPTATVNLIARRDSYPCGRVITHCFYDQPTPPEGQAGTWTCICGVMIYRDELFSVSAGDSPSFAKRNLGPSPNSESNLFVSDGVYNCVHRMIVEPDGSTFHGRRAPGEERSEFLASADPWFRPATLRTGPDGALWVVDMYRFVIEHPEWIDDQLEKQLELRAGCDRGRIYRVYPVGKKPRPIPRLDKLDTAGLVAALDSPNGWQRDMAQQMLIWRGDKAAVGPLGNMMTMHPRPLARLHAMCTLDGLGELAPLDIRWALRPEEHPGVRRHAVRLSERFAAPDASDKDLLKSLDELVDDPDPQVRLQLAYTLGQFHDERAGRALARLSRQANDDPSLAAAVMSSAVPHLETMLETLFARHDAPAEPGDVVGSLFSAAVAKNNERTLVKVLSDLRARKDRDVAIRQMSAMPLLLDALGRRGSSLAQLVADGDAELRQAIANTIPIFEAARYMAANPKATANERATAIRLLGRGPDQQTDDIERLAGLLVPQTPLELQLAVVESLGRLGRPEVPELLLDVWDEQGPLVHGAALDVLLRRPAWTEALLDEMQSRPELARGLDATRRDLLLRHREEPIRNRAKKLLGAASTPQAIQRQLKKFQTVLTTPGDAERGKKVFVEATCSNCHTLAGIGEENIGPDLRTLVDKSPGALLTATIDPNRAVEDRFVAYTALTADGLQQTGMLLEETGTTITLADANGKKHAILREDLEELLSTGRSQMAEGLEAKLTVQQLADLFALIGGTGPPRKEFAGNQPQKCDPCGQGILTLPASAAEIYGPDIRFESQYGNLGYWTSAEAYVAWTIEVPAPRAYQLWLDWACPFDSDQAGFRVEVAGTSLTGKVPQTGSWNAYQQAEFGRIELEPGTHRLVFRSAGPLSQPLLDLRTIRLVPVQNGQ